MLSVVAFTGCSTNSLSVQSFSSASVILNLNELPCPGGFPATFRLSVVPRPWRTIVSITVRLFLNRFPNEKHSFRIWTYTVITERCCSGVTWLWGGMTRCGCSQGWTSHWMTWLLQAEGGGCTQKVWLSLQQTLHCSSLSMSAKQTEGLWETNSFHMLPEPRTRGPLLRTIISGSLTWFLWTWNSKVRVSMLILDKFPNGNLKGKRKYPRC